MGSQRPSRDGRPHGRSCCREALVAGRPSLPVVAGKRCREALVAGRPSLPGGRLVGATSWKRVPPRDRPERCSKSFILWQNLTWQNPASISRIQVSLPGSPRCREALLAGRPSLPGGPRCREALVAGRPSLPGGPRCREALVAGPFPGLFLASSGPLPASSGPLPASSSGFLDSGPKTLLKGGRIDLVQGLGFLILGIAAAIQRRFCLAAQPYRLGPAARLSASPTVRRRLPVSLLRPAP